MAHPSENPLLAPWAAPFGAPPFADIRPEHFRPAFEAALAERAAEIDAIAGDAAPACFANTIEALERGGRALDRVSAVFFNLLGADGSDALEAIERDVAPILSRAHSDIALNPALFARVTAVFERRASSRLDAERMRLLERTHKRFVRAGAALDPLAKGRLKDIGERMASLGAQFGQNVLADEKAWLLLLETPDDRAGLPQSFLAAAAQAAVERGHAGGHAVTLSRSSVEPFLSLSPRRDLREKAFRAFAARGANGGKHDNRAIASEMAKLRAERAKLLGYASYAHFRLDDTMAKTPQAAHGLLDKVWAPARLAALRDAEDLQATIAVEGGNFALAPWDWRYYAEKRRKALFDVDEAELKPYLPLDGVVEAAFHVAGKLFGLNFTERRDIALHHADARAWTVLREGEEVALFIGDYFNRASKHSGAWMSSFRDQEKLDGAVKPIIVNVMNFAKAGAGEACLLSFDDARTLFHEFGHALHGLLSDVTYPSLAGTNVARDFVEFPSQLYEHWLEEPDILRQFARHHETGAPMPDGLIERMAAARRFNQAFATVEFTACALFDLDLHLIADPGDLDIAAFEAERLAAIGMPAGIAMRHGAAHFQHIFSAEGYSAGYYSYLWSEILDADGFEAFKASGDIFDPALAKRLRDYVYAAGNLREPDEAYAKFRGRAPAPEALLRKRGLGV